MPARAQAHAETDVARKRPAGLSQRAVRRGRYTTVRRTSTLPRVALEYGQTWWAFCHQRFGVGAGEAGQRDGKVDIEAEAAFRARADADGGGHGGVRGHLHAAALSGNRLHRADEAGGIAGRKQLFGIVAGATAAAEFLRGRKLDAEGAVSRRGGAVAAAGGCCGGLVEDFHGHVGLPWGWFRWQLYCTQLDCAQ